MNAWREVALTLESAILCSSCGGQHLIPIADYIDYCHYYWYCRCHCHCYCWCWCCCCYHCYYHYTMPLLLLLLPLFLSLFASLSLSLVFFVAATPLTDHWPQHVQVIAEISILLRHRMCPHSLCRTGEPSRSISSPWVLNFLKRPDWRPDLACHAACFMFCYCVHLMISWCCICIYGLFPQEILQKNPDLPQDCTKCCLVIWMRLTCFETCTHTHRHSHSQDFLAEAAATNPEIVRAQQHLPQSTNVSQLMSKKQYRVDICRYTEYRLYRCVLSCLRSQVAWQSGSGSYRLIFEWPVAVLILAPTPQLCVSAESHHSLRHYLLPDLRADHELVECFVGALTWHFHHFVSAEHRYMCRLMFIKGSIS